MKRTLPEFLAQAVQGEGLVEMLLDEAANRLHPIGLRVAVEGPGPATQTGPISGLLGLFGPAEKVDVLAPGPAGRARWPAIHPCARDGEHEFSIAGGVACQHGIPAWIVDRFRWGVNRDAHLVGRAKPRLWLPAFQEFSQQCGKNR